VNGRIEGRVNLNKKLAELDSKLAEFNKELSLREFKSGNRTRYFDCFI